MIALRAYQGQGVSDIGRALRSGFRRPIWVGPTGCGKTTMFAAMARSMGERGKRVLVLVHRRELLTQASARLDAMGVPHGLMAPGAPWVPRLVQVGSVGTVARRLAVLDALRWAPDLLLVDEGHHAVLGSTWGAVLDHWPAARAVFFTATPLRLDGRGLGAHAGGYADALIDGPSVADLTQAGYLVPVEIDLPGAAVADVSGLKLRHGDFVPAEIAALTDRPAVIGDAVAHYLAHRRGLPAIAFCCSIAHAEHVAEAFVARGVRAASIDGSLSGLERERLLRDLAGGGLEVLTSCALIDEGLDVPAATVAILLRYTASVAMHRQQVGRVLRPAAGKPLAVICDHVQNCLRHGPPDKVIDWSLDGHVSAHGSSVAVPEGPGRGAIERVPEVLPGELVTAVPDGFGGMRVSPRDLAVHREALRRIERARGYPAGWADRLGAAVAA